MSNDLESKRDPRPHGRRILPRGAPDGARVGLSLFLAVFFAAWLPLPAATLDGPLTEEDVVRMFVAGRPVVEILLEIERRDPDYDTSPEMLEELRRIELPEPVIEAMRARMSTRRRLEARIEETLPDASVPMLRIRLNPARPETGGKVSVRARVDPELAAEWELGNAPEDRTFAGLALFVACLRPDHVPDQWRIKSPLGRDFLFAPRHKVLEFVAGETGEAHAGRGRHVHLELPPTLEIPLTPDTEHDLMIGLALQTGGRYYAALSDTLPDIVVGEGGLELEARVKGHDLRTLEVRFLDERSRTNREGPRGVRGAPGNRTSCEGS